MKLWKLSVVLCAACGAPGIEPPPPIELVSDEWRQEAVPVVERAVHEATDVVLDLDGALDLALERSPRLDLTRGQVERLTAQAEQVGVWRNPSLVGGVEGAPFEGGTFSGAEILFGVTTFLPVGGRVGKAREVAELQAHVGHERVRAQLAEVRRDIHGRFATALHAQETRRLFDELAQVAGERVELMQARLESGDAVEGDVARLRIERGQAQREARRARTAWEMAAQALAAAIGDPGLNVTALEGQLESTLAFPELTELVRGLEDHPAMSAAMASSEAARARVELAKAQRIPDVQLDLLYRRDEAIDQDGFDALVTLPLPIFNTGEARVQARRSSLVLAQARERSARIELETRLRSAHAAAALALDELELLREEVLPHAEEAYATARSRFELGDGAFDEALLARRALSILRLEERSLQRDALRAWAELAAFLPEQP